MYVGWMEDKLRECMENGGYAWFDSREQDMEWADWCSSWRGKM